MRCTKCHGLMVVERYEDFFETCHVARCVNCGLITDRTIMANRLHCRVGIVYPKLEERAAA